MMQVSDLKPIHKAGQDTIHIDKVYLNGLMQDEWIMAEDRSYEYKVAEFYTKDLWRAQNLINANLAMWAPVPCQYDGLTGKYEDDAEIIYQLRAKWVY